MKQLNQYPTPVTDASLARMKLSGYGGLVELNVSRELERKLAACRQFIFETAKTSSSSRIRREASQIFAATAP